jgi:defect-in-organelle-trafficking protein DotB
MFSTFEPSERTERAFALMETIRLIVTQTLVPKIGGGRVALREYMPFTEEVRERMLNMPFDKWPFELIQMVPKYGRTMEQAARSAFEKGEIERRFYLMYAHGAKIVEDATGQDAKGAENKDGGH